jgi:uncharacterized membrane protein YraQ (UPF0718 family)
MELRRRGASRPATRSFLIATPQTGVDSVILSWVLLNPVFAVARVIGSLVTALVTGAAELLFGGEDKPMADSARPAASCCSSTKPAAPEPAASSSCSTTHRHDAAPPAAAPGWRARFLSGQAYAFGDLLPKMARYYIIGLLATGVIMALVPDGWLERYLGGGLAGMVVVAVMGVALYICASAATPLAAVLVAKGMSPGTALVMLLAGPAASVASLAAVRAMIGTRGLAIYLTSITACAIAIGLGLDAFFLLSGIPVVVGQAAHHAHEHLGPVSHAAALIVAALFLWHGTNVLRARLARPAAVPAPSSATTTIRAEALED